MTKDEMVTLSVRVDKKVADKIDWICEQNKRLAGISMARTDWLKKAIDMKLRADC